MKMFVICDNTDTFTGLRLVGVDGKIVKTQDELKEVISEALADKEIGILLIAEKLSRQFPKTISDIKLSVTLPLIVEIPDRFGTARPKDFLTRYVKEAVGVRL